MLDNNFDAEKSIKNWAVIIRTLGISLMCLCGLAAFILLCVDAQYLWWISLIILGVGVLTLIYTSFLWVLIWGYGDLIGNTKKISTGTIAPTRNENDDELPDL